jgi:hypothetical protein
VTAALIVVFLLLTITVICTAEHLNETAVEALPSDLMAGAIERVAQVNYTDPECHFHPLSLSLSCLYDREWEEQVVLGSGGGENALPTMGYWRLAMAGEVWGSNGDGGLAVYGPEVEWQCRIVRGIHTTTPFSVGGKRVIAHIILIPAQDHLRHPLRRRGWLQ